MAEPAGDEQVQVSQDPPQWSLSSPRRYGEHLASCVSSQMELLRRVKSSWW